MGLLTSLKILEPKKPTAAELKSGEIGPKITEAAFAIYSQLGGGLDADIYKKCFYQEMKQQGIPFGQDVGFDIDYKGSAIEAAFTADFVIAGQAVVSIIAEEKSAVHDLKIRSMLKNSGLKEAYIINFRVADMRSGVMRAVFQDDSNVTAMPANKQPVNKQQVN